MKKSVLFIVIIHICYSTLSQEITALEILNRVEERHALANSTHFKISGNGLYQNDRHLASRNQLNKYELSYTIEYHNTNVHFTTKSIHKSSTREFATTTKYIDDVEYSYNASKNSYFKTHPNNNLGNTLRTYYLNPSLLIKYIINNAKTLEVLTRGSENSYQLNIQFHNDENWVLTISNDFLCQSFSHASFNYLYGDVEEKIMYNNYKATDFGLFPEKVVVERDGYEQYNLSQHISELTTDFEAISISEIKNKKEQKKKDRIVTADSISINKIKPALYEVRLTETNNRLLIAEFENFLILIEGSYHSKNGDLIIKIIEDKFDNKPIKYASFSHCHTQYIGMSRSYVANDILILTTEDNLNFIKKLAMAPFSLRPDKQELEPKQPIFQEVTDSWAYEDSLNSIEIYNIQSNHTDTYLVFYFPREKLMFVGDMLWISEENKKPLSGKSLVFYNEVVTRLNLDIETYMTSWPLNYYGVKNIITKDEISKHK